MKSLYILLVVQFAVVWSKLAAKPPACRKSDPGVSKCLLNALQQSLVLLRHGNGQVPSFEPLLLPRFEFARKFSDVMEVDVVLTDVRFDGLTQTNISNFKFHPETLTFEFNLAHPHIVIDLDFKGSGKLAGYSTENQSHINITIDDVKSHVSMSFLKKQTLKRDDQHFVVSNLKLKMQVKRAQIKLLTKNPSEQAFLDFFSKMFNKNSKTFLDMAEPVYTTIIQDILVNEVNKLMVQIPATNILVD